ncbi:GPI-anchored wall transfer protein 1 [Terfezia claveryi]|nr:GPI-anchored wall transfer protein 1 [Terfezia claveryi]
MPKPVKSYKERKEDFVSNHYGGTISEINLITAVAPSAYILYSVLQSRLQFFTPYGPLQFFCDFLLNTLAILFSVTVYSSYPALLNILILTPAIFIYLTQKPVPQRAVPVEAKKRKNELAAASASGELVMPKKAFLTAYRGGMMVITCIAILAVDFKIFPRRFAKVENWGTSLMDLGVGSFVFSGGLVSASAVLKELHAFQQAQVKGVQYIPINAAKRVSATIRSAVPLLVLGCIRLATVKGTDYAEHITEYGYHWNFFFTLGLLPPFVQLFQSLLFFLPKRVLTVDRLPVIYALLSLAVVSSYQIILETTGLKKFILIGERELWGLIGWNKEGIFSFFGYLSIFLAGMSTGCYLLLAYQEVPSARRFWVGALGKKLMTWSAIWVVAFLISYEYRGLNLAVSRRMANLPYVLWVTAYNICQITTFYLIESILFGGVKAAGGTKRDEERYKLATPQILEVFNKEGLPIFLVANVLTGAINLSLNTLDMPNHLAVGVLVGYAFVLTAVAIGMGVSRWRSFLPF